MKRVEHIGDAELWLGDCVESMQAMPAGSVQTCVTSPPYFGLRDYGTATWDGGDPGCDHVEQYTNPQVSACSGGITNKRPDLEHRQTASMNGWKQFRDTCGKCGARRIDQQIGLEATPSCGAHGLMRLRRDLTEDQRRYAVQRLLGVAGSGALNGGTDGTK